MDNVFDTLKAKFPFVEARPSGDHLAVNVPADQLLEVALTLRDELGYDMLLDLCGVDWDKASPRFEVIYHFYHSGKKSYLRVATAARNDAQPVVPSLTGLWAAADWPERETFDMFGVRFAGHPDLKRILMWDGYEFHPLRKEFPLAGIETNLPAADVAEATKAKVIAAPMMGGPFDARVSDHHHMSESEPRAGDESWTEKNPKPGMQG